MASSQSNNRLKYSLIAIGVVIVAFIIILIAKSPTTQNPTSSDALAPSSLVNKLTSVSDKVFAAVGIGSTSAFPKPISGTSLTQNGKPEVLYMGAEYCPYCATERWPLIVALSRFGTITGLKTTHSSTSDVYADTQTFSFDGSSYSSPYLVFTPVELYTNVPTSTGYTTLQTPTAKQQSLMNTYDSPPYVSSSSTGAIPFVYFAGKYLLSGATYSPAVLQSKSREQIASALTDSSNTITQGLIGSANVLTAAICGITNNQPGSVCNSQIQGIENTLNKQ